MNREPIKSTTLSDHFTLGRFTFGRLRVARFVRPLVITACVSFFALSTAQAQEESGKLAWYGQEFAGRKTANGQRYDPNALTMAHKTLPFGAQVKVTNTANQRSVVVRVNDRGPSTPDRIGDVSQAAAQRLGMLHSGTIDAKLEVVGKR